MAKILVLDGTNNLPIGFLEDSVIESRLRRQPEFYLRGRTYLRSIASADLLTAKEPVAARLRWRDLGSTRPPELKRHMAKGLRYRARLLQCLEGADALLTIPPPEYCTFAELFGEPSR